MTNISPIMSQLALIRFQTLRNKGNFAGGSFISTGNVVDGVVDDDDDDDCDDDDEEEAEETHFEGNRQPRI